MKASNLNVSVLGLGSMGAALASTLIEKGFEVTVWNRDQSKVRPLLNKGAVSADSVAAAITASQVTVVCVSNYAAASSLLTQTAVAALEGRTLIHLSTGTPKEARDMESYITSNGAAYIDGAILAWPGQIGGEQTTILVSGSKAVFETVEPVMKALAGNTTYMGELISDASALFSAVLAYLAGQWIGFCHGALICETEGLDAEHFGTIMHKLSPVLGAELAHMGKVIRHDAFYKPESTLKTSGADIAGLVKHAQEAGINDELPKFAANLFKRAVDAGHGEEEHAAIIKVMR